jgi:hypothetical protein
MPAQLLGAAIVHEDPEVHLRLAAQFFDIPKELPLVRPDGLAQALVVMKNRSEAERQDGRVLKAIGNDPCMVHARFLVQVFYWIVLADDNGQLTGGIQEDLISTHAMYGL